MLIRGRNALFSILLCILAIQAARANGEEKMSPTMVRQAAVRKTVGEIDAIKFFIPKDGLYKITYRDMKNLGLSPEEVDFNKTALFASGFEYPFLIRGFEDGSFDRDDYLVFYGRQPRGATTYRYKYSDDNVYRLEFNRKGQLNSQQVYHPGEADLIPAGDVLMRKIHFEQDTTLERFSNPYGVDTDFCFWFPIQWALDKNHRFVYFDLPGLDENSAGRTAAFSVYSYGRSQEAVPDTHDHNIEYTVNSFYLGESRWSRYTEHLFVKKDVPANVLLPLKNELDFDLIATTGITLDTIMLDWFEVDYPIVSKAINNTLDFFVQKGHYKQTREISVSDFTTDRIYLYNVSSNTFIKPGISQDPSGKYKAAFVAEQSDVVNYQITAEPALLSPSRIVLSRYYGIREPDNAAEYIIISHEDFLAQAERLAKYRAKRGLATRMIPVDSIYDEFNHSLISPESIKEAISHIYHNWKTPQLKYVLLIGDWSWDWHNLEKTQKQNFIPTWYVPHYLIEYATDSYFASVDNDFIPEVALGRLPVKNAAEAETVVSKLINYEINFTDEVWRHKVMLTASAAEHFHEFCEQMYDEYLKDRFIVQKGYCDPRSPLLVTQAIIDACNEGIGLLLYAGHGSRYYWLTATSIGHDSQDLEYNFQPEKLDEIHNPYKTPIVFAATCFTNNFDNPASRNCIGERFLIKENGGALGVIASSSYSYIDNDKSFVDEMFNAAFEQGNNCLGDIFLYASRNCPSEEAVKMFLLLGDPASRHGLIPIVETQPQVQEDVPGVKSWRIY